jgi:hypothetical protein
LVAPYDPWHSATGNGIYHLVSVIWGDSRLQMTGMTFTKCDTSGLVGADQSLTTARCVTTGKSDINWRCTNVPESARNFLTARGLTKKSTRAKAGRCHVCQKQKSGQMREPVVRRKAGAVPNSEVRLNTNTANPAKNRQRAIRSNAGNASINHGRRSSSSRRGDARRPARLPKSSRGRAKRRMVD